MGERLGSRPRLAVLDVESEPRQGKTEFQSGMVKAPHASTREACPKNEKDGCRDNDLPLCSLVHFVSATERSGAPAARLATYGAAGGWSLLVLGFRHEVENRNNRPVRGRVLRLDGLLLASRLHRNETLSFRNSDGRR